MSSPSRTAPDVLFLTGRKTTTGSWLDIRRSWMRSEKWMRRNKPRLSNRIRWSMDELTPLKFRLSASSYRLKWFDILRTFIKPLSIPLRQAWHERRFPKHAAWTLRGSFLERWTWAFLRMGLVLRYWATDFIRFKQISQRFTTVSGTEAAKKGTAFCDTLHSWSCRKKTLEHPGQNRRGKVKGRAGDHLRNPGHRFWSLWPQKE